LVKGPSPHLWKKKGRKEGAVGQTGSRPQPNPGRVSGKQRFKGGDREGGESGKRPLKGKSRSTKGKNKQETKQSKGGEHAALGWKSGRLEHAKDSLPPISLVIKKRKK